MLESVLIVSKDPNIVKKLRGVCAEIHIPDETVFCTVDYDEACKCLRTLQPDLIFFDQEANMFNPYDFLGKARDRSQKCIIIFLETDNLDDELGVEIALTYDVDNIINRSASNRLIKAVINARYRRLMKTSQNEIPGTIIKGPITICKESRVVRYNGNPIHLTPLEFALLCYLSDRPWFVCTHRQLFEEIWDRRASNDFSTISVHIARLRRIIGDTGRRKGERLIETEIGVGYWFQVLPE